MTAGSTSGGSDGTGSAGTDGGSGVTGGVTSGASSAATSGGGGEAYCRHHCAVDADCVVQGHDVGLVCKDTQCQATAPQCTDDGACVALLSGWTTPCTSGGGECEQDMQVCVKVEGGAACATPPSDFFACDIVPDWSEVQAQDVDGNPVTVCGNANGKCHPDGYCFTPCKSDGDCVPVAPICDVPSGQCRCGTDADCANSGAAQASICLPNGACGCNADQQCVDGKTGDVCTSQGYCGCSGDAACAGYEFGFDGGTVTCDD